MLARLFRRPAGATLVFAASRHACRALHHHSPPLLSAAHTRSMGKGGTVGSRTAPPTAAPSRRQQRRASVSSTGAAAAPPRAASPGRARAAASAPHRSQAQAQAQQPGSHAAAEGGGTRSARGTPRVGRFNRITAEKGLAFAAYLYVLGESTTMGLTYLLHTDSLPVGGVGRWVCSVAGDGAVETYLDRGPRVLGVRLSPLLLLNYLVANICTYPLYRYQYAFCVATAPVISRATAPLRQLLRASRKRKSAIPRAPSPSS